MSDCCEVVRDGDGATAQEWVEDLWLTEDWETVGESRARFERVMKILGLKSRHMIFVERENARKSK